MSAKPHIYDTYMYCIQDADVGKACLRMVQLQHVFTWGLVTKRRGHQNLRPAYCLAAAGSRLSRYVSILARVLACCWFDVRLSILSSNAYNPEDLSLVTPRQSFFWLSANVLCTQQTLRLNPPCLLLACLLAHCTFATMFSLFATCACECTTAQRQVSA